jgi:hypothetical protein
MKGEMTEIHRRTKETKCPAHAHRVRFLARYDLINTRAVLWSICHVSEKTMNSDFRFGMSALLSFAARHLLCIRRILTARFMQF